MKYILSLLTTLFALTSQLTIAQEWPTPCNDEAKYSIHGIIIGGTDQRPKIEFNSTYGLLKIGDRGEISKQFETNLFGAAVTGWLGLGKAEITSIKGNIVEFATHELPEVKINDKTKKLYVKGRTIKFECYDYPGEYTDTLYYDNGKVNAYGLVNCGKAVGLWNVLDQKGMLESRRNYSQDGELNGEYLEYDNGILIFKGQLQNGEPHGVCEYYSSSGKLEKQITFKEGKKHGSHKKYDTYSGIVEEEGNYFEDVPTGTWKYYGEKDGKRYLKEENTFKEGKINGSYKTWYANGQLKEEGALIENEAVKSVNLESFSFCLIMLKRNHVSGAHGLWRKYYENGQIKLECTYNQGIAEGNTSRWTQEGKIAAKGPCINGEQSGLWITNHPSGQLKTEINYKAGKKDGSSRTFYPNGQLEASGAYKDDKKKGLWQTYYDNGKSKSIGSYQEDALIGTWKFWDEKGKRRKEKH